MAHAWWRDVDYELFNRITRERDEARAAILEPGGWEAMYKGQRDRADKAERERDEARAEIERLRTAGDSFGFGRLLSEELSRELAIMRRERDEARAEIERLRAECGAMRRGEIPQSLWQGVTDVLAVERERDEARALLRDIEWSSMDRNGHACCPCCGRVDTQGHNSVCRLDAALGKGGAR